MISMIEQRCREPVYPLQHPIGSGCPASCSHLRDNPLKSTWRADSLRCPGLKRFRKAMLHDAFRTERQCDVSVRACMKIQHSARLCSKVYDGASLQNLQYDDLLLH